MDECIDSLEEVIIFSKLDVNSGCRQIKINEPNQDKTTFTSHHGLHLFKHMPFEFQNARGTLQGTTDVILFTVIWQLALVYLDDFVAFPRTPENPTFHVQHVQTLLNNTRVTLNFKMCTLFHGHRRLARTGHTLSSAGNCITNNKQN